MEELNTMSAADPQEEKLERKPYTPPTADIILLVPKEELAGWDYQYHKDIENSAADRWALNGWNSFKYDAVSGIDGAVYSPKDTWNLQ